MIVWSSKSGRPEAEPERSQDLQFFEEREYEGSRITLNFQDIQVRSVLQLIADVSDLNIVVSDSVTGSLTLRLTNVPWDQALDIVLETKNLDMRRSGNVIWIAPTAEIAQREAADSSRQGRSSDTGATAYRDDFSQLCQCQRIGCPDSISLVE